MRKIRIALNCTVALFLIALTSINYQGEYFNLPLNVVSTLERQAYDWRLERNIKNGKKNTEIVIIDIDRDSLRALEAWPWSRDLFADMLRQLYEKYQVRAAAFTFPLTGADDEGLHIFDSVRDEMQESGINLTPRVQSQLNRARQRFAYDKLLVDTMRKQPVFLGYRFDESARVSGGLPPSVDFYDENDINKKIGTDELRDLTENWHFYRGFSGNFLPLLKVSKGAGFVNFLPDSDGFVRSGPMAVLHAKRYYESLPIALLRRADNPGQVLDLIAERNSGIIDSLFVGRRRAYVDERAVMYLNFYGTGGRFVDFENDPRAVFRYVPAVDVIRGSVEDGGKPLKDKIVLIGSSSEALRDIHATPLNRQMPGVELLATQMANMMDNMVLHRPPDANALALALLVGLALAAAAAFAFMGPLFSSVITAALCGGFVYVGINLWDEELKIISMVPPLFVFIGLFLWNSVSGFVFEWRASQQLKSSFGLYVPPELAKRIGEQKSISLEGESRVISVLFSDVRGFTAISETYTPVDLTRMMNRMLTVLSEAVYDSGGTVDKFIGDAVMAFWNAPLEDPQHALNALKGGLAMQSAMKELSAELQEEGHPPMKLGVGICTGEANVGNMGSALRMAYTAMGDTVNVASRVEGLTKYYKVGILVTDSTYAACRDTEMGFRLADIVQVKGREQTLSIYEPIGDKNLLETNERQALEHYNQMRDAYTAGNFAEANEKIKVLRQMTPEDGLVEVYEERITNYLQNPPTEWDGTTSFDVK